MQIQLDRSNGILRKRPSNDVNNSSEKEVLGKEKSQENINGQLGSGGSLDENQLGQDLKSVEIQEEEESKEELQPLIKLIYDNASFKITPELKQAE